MRTAAQWQRNTALLARWEGGVPTEDIAVEFGVSLARVKQLAQRAGAVRPPGYRRAPQLMIATRDFWTWVDRRGPDDCWEWLGPRQPQGYGAGLAHRRAYKLAVGPIPDGMMVLHSCDNPPCCNPAHLRVGTALDNSDDMRARGRQPRPRR